MREVMDRLSMMQTTTCGQYRTRTPIVLRRPRHGAGEYEGRPDHHHQPRHQPAAQGPIERMRNDAAVEQRQGCAEGDGPRAYPDTGRPLRTREMWGHGDCFVAEETTIDATSGQLTQIMQTTKEAAPGPMPFPTSRLIEAGTGTPCRAPRDQDTGNVAGIGDSLDRDRYQVRRNPDETVHQ